MGTQVFPSQTNYRLAVNPIPANIFRNFSSFRCYLGQLMLNLLSATAFKLKQVSSLFFFKFTLSLDVSKLGNADGLMSDDVYHKLLVLLLCSFLIIEAFFSISQTEVLSITFCSPCQSSVAGNPG